MMTEIRENDVLSRRFATVFIDNLPHVCWKVWLHNLFSRFGKIQSIYIPNKKSRRTGNQFGFVRFGSPVDAQRAVKETNGLWIWGKILVANIARFGVQNKFERMQSSGPEVNGQGMSSGVGLNGRRLNLLKAGRPKNERGLSSNMSIAQYKPKTNAQVWRKKEIPLDQKKQWSSHWAKILPPVKVKELGNGWLYRSVIAKLLSTCSIVRIQDQLRNLGHAHVLVRHMGGDMVVLTFKDTEERDSMFTEGKMAWLKEWFVESSKWENTKSNPCSRLVWLNCYGIPLHLWNYQTFSEIGKIWGEVIMLAEDTLKNLSFAVGKVLISTTVMDLINKVVELDNKGNLIQIRVMEEQLVVNTVLRTDCACPGCQVEASSLHQPLDDSSVQSITKKDNGDDTRSKLPLIEEVAESRSTPLEVVPSLLGPYPTLANIPLCMDNTNNMQLVPFTGINCIKHTTLSSRSVEHAPPKGRGTVTPYLDALLSNLMLPKPHISPLKVNSFLPLIPNYVSHGFQNNLSIVPHKKQDTHIDPNDSIQVSILPSLSKKNIKLDDKPKKKQRSIEDILGLPKRGRSKKGGRRTKQRCVVFRSAMAAAALSVSTEGIINRNRILLSESQVARSVTKILETDYMGNDEEVISKIMVTDEEDELRTVLLTQSNQ